MSEYADVRFHKIKILLDWLQRKNEHISVRSGKHNYTIKYVYQERPYPIPTNHGVVNKHIVKALMKVLTVQWRICTKEEFDEIIK